MCLREDKFFAVSDCGAKVFCLSSCPPGEGTLIKLIGTAVNDFFRVLHGDVFSAERYQKTSRCLALHSTLRRWKHDWLATAQRQRDTTTPPDPASVVGRLHLLCRGYTEAGSVQARAWNSNLPVLAHQSAVHRRGVQWRGLNDIFVSGKALAAGFASVLTIFTGG